MCPATHGADRVIETLAAGGVDVCFTNPGTSEMQLVAAFDRMGGATCCDVADSHSQRGQKCQVIRAEGDGRNIFKFHMLTASIAD